MKNPRSAIRPGLRPKFPSPASGGETTYDLSLLDQSQRRWSESSALRAYYRQIYLEMAQHACAGPALELGSGCGHARECIPGVITSDVQKTAYVDLAVSAYAVERAPGGPWASLYLLDVLHHLCEPMRFLASAAAALRPGGRIVICDPAATAGGRWFYRLFHHEPTEPDSIEAPYRFAPDPQTGEFANMGMAWALFVRDRASVQEQIAEFGLSIRHARYRDVLAYPATGGFSGPRLLPEKGINALLSIERVLPAALLRLIALRLLVVIEKTA